LSFLPDAFCGCDDKVARTLQDKLGIELPYWQLKRSFRDLILIIQILRFKPWLKNSLQRRRETCWWRGIGTCHRIPMGCDLLFGERSTRNHPVRCCTRYQQMSTFMQRKYSFGVVTWFMGAAWVIRKASWEHCGRMDSCPFTSCMLEWLHTQNFLF
jgi:hypothetical protein